MISGTRTERSFHFPSIARNREKCPPSLGRALTGLACALAVILAPLSLTAADETQLQTLADALSERAGEPLQFRELRESELLTEPLELHGRLTFTPPDRFEKIIESPYRESQLITQGRVWLDREGRRTRSFSLSRAPELAALMNGLARLLSGDAAGLEEHFRTTLEHTGENWRLELVPRDDELAQTVARILLHGRADALTRIETVLPDGETVRTEIL